MKRLFKMNWKFFLNNRGEVDLSANPDNDGGSFADAISQSMDDATPTDSQPKDQPITTPAVDIEGYKGPDRRSKGYEGDKRRQSDKALDDPEYEMDWESDPGKGNQKLKLSEMKDTIKWLNGNRKSIDGAMKIRELAGKHPEFGKLLNEVISKSFKEDSQLNTEFVGNSLKQLTAKAERIEERIDDKDDEITRAEQLLNSDEIDPDSVQAQVLKSNIMAMKATKKQLSQALSKIDDFTKNIGELKESQNTFLKKHDDAVQAVEVKRLSDIYQKEIGALAADTNSYKFIDQDERSEFDAKVRELVARSAKDVKNDESFVKVVRDSFKAAYDRTRKLREAAVNDYLRQKGKLPKEEEKKTEKEIDPEDERSIGQILADHVYAEG